jgi:hypothetical protein
LSFLGSKKIRKSFKLFFSALFFALGDAGAFRKLSSILSENTVEKSSLQILTFFPDISQFSNPFKVKNSPFQVPYFSPFFELLFQEKVLNEKRREEQ